MDKHILDPLYGDVSLPGYAWAISKAPEIQRLREVRMCNINSLSLTGAGGVHRFEHSLGTAFLAQINSAADRSRFNRDDVRLLTLAGLLHDVGSAGFGHSVEYMIHGDGFRHDDLMAFESPWADSEGYEYKTTDLEPVFFGRPQTLSADMSHSDLKKISTLVRGEGRLGPLISGSIDLDNVDNVYRLAYHMGLWRGGSAPINLAEALYVDGEGLCIDDRAVDALNDWRVVRSELYSWLLLDEDEFAAKAMLEGALRSAYEESNRSFRWNDVDYALMLKLSRATPGAAELADRIMTGNLFGCLGVFETAAGSMETPSWPDRDSLEAALQERLRSGSKRLAKLGVALHFIQDVNKTDRSVQARTSSGREVRFGSSIDRTLIGVFARNPSLAADTPDLLQLRDGGLGELVVRELGQLLETPVRPVRGRRADNNGRLEYFA